MHGTQTFTYINESSDDRVALDAIDGDRFVMSTKDVVEACRWFEAGLAGTQTETSVTAKQVGEVLLAGREKIKAEWDYLIDKVNSWIQLHVARIKQVTIEPHDNRYLMVVCTAPGVYDSALEEELTRFDMQMARDKYLNRIILDVAMTALPATAPLLPSSE